MEIKRRWGRWSSAWCVLTWKTSAQCRVCINKHRLFVVYWEEDKKLMYQSVFLKKYLLPEVWGIQQSAEVTNSKAFGFVQQKTTKRPVRCRGRNKFICLRRAWQEHIYLSPRTGRVKEWLCGPTVRWLYLGWNGRWGSRNTSHCFQILNAYHGWFQEKMLFMALFELSSDYLWFCRQGRQRCLPSVLSSTLPPPARLFIYPRRTSEDMSVGTKDCVFMTLDGESWGVFIPCTQVISLPAQTGCFTVALWRGGVDVSAFVTIKKCSTVLGKNNLALCYVHWSLGGAACLDSSGYLSIWTPDYELFSPS